MSSKTLPVERVADRIRECVFQNRVTIIIGKTGCGKSSRVPQLLQEELHGPIICTQPRRLAVVAIARHVAQLTGSELGREIGFRIGQKSVISHKTKILFTTAGLLLEELRANGAAALKKYSCLIVDELHERSVESDLLLACVHAMMMPGAAAESELPRLRLVLMSATANVERYRHYFKLPGDHVSLIQCDMADHFGSVIGQWLETVKHVYLEGVVHQVLAGHPNTLQHQSLLLQHKEGTISAQQQVDLPMQMLIRDLILTLHQRESDPQAVILVFLPTYRALELQHRLLSELKGLNGTAGQAAASLELFPLHSSVDIDEAMRSMQLVAADGHRKVILATNVAESSVTIPHVRHVIDACTSNQVFWDVGLCRDRAQVIWACQSAADQRAGRTGRTCSGTCYRLLPKARFFKLDKFEASALTLRSLRREVLCLLSAGSKSMSDPEALLAQALDPPETNRVSQAMDYLQQIGAARLNAKGHLEPSPTGAFIAALPISLESALLFLKGGQQGHVWEAAVLAALMNTTPYPIKQPFGSQAMQHVRLYHYGTRTTAAAEGTKGLTATGTGLSSCNLACGYEGMDSGFDVCRSGSSLELDALKKSQGHVDRSVLLLANMSAFEAWQMHWCDVQRLKQLLQHGQDSSVGISSCGDEGSSSEQDAGEEDDVHEDDDGLFVSVSSLVSPAVDAVEAEWCQQHHLVPSSLRHVADTVSTMLAAMHKFRPSFVNNIVGPPSYYLTGVHHHCQFRTPSCSAASSGSFCECEGLQVTSLHSPGQLTGLQELLKQVFQGGAAAADALLLTGASLNDSSTSKHPTSSVTVQNRIVEAAADAAVYGLLEVDLNEKDVDVNRDLDTRPPCRFFLSETGCRNGWRCLFKHSRPACRFFMSKDGCRYGAACRFNHSDPTDNKPLSEAATTTAGTSPLQQQEADQGLTFDWDLGLGSGTYNSVLLSGEGSEGLVLLLGEGDFSFTEVVLRRRIEAGIVTAGARLVSTSFEQLDQLHQIYPGPALKRRMKLLTTSGVDVRYGVDATRLHDTLPGLHVSKVQHIVWNFPLAVSAELSDAPESSRGLKLLGDDDAANRQLMADFMPAAAGQMICYNPSMQVHIALCLDQYSRWGIEQIAGDNFLFLQQSRPLNLSEWRGYVPRRGLLDGGFPVDRAVVYSFALHLPSVHVANVKALQVRMRVLAAQALRRRQSSNEAGCGGTKLHDSSVGIMASSTLEPSNTVFVF